MIQVKTVRVVLDKSICSVLDLKCKCESNEKEERCLLRGRAEGGGNLEA